MNWLKFLAFWLVAITISVAAWIAIFTTTLRLIGLW